MINMTFTPFSRTEKYQYATDWQSVTLDNTLETRVVIYSSTPLSEIVTTIHSSDLNQLRKQGAVLSNEFRTKER